MTVNWSVDLYWQLCNCLHLLDLSLHIFSLTVLYPCWSTERRHCTAVWCISSLIGPFPRPPASRLSMISASWGLRCLAPLIPSCQWKTINTSSWRTSWTVRAMRVIWKRTECRCFCFVAVVNYYSVPVQCSWSASRFRKLPSISAKRTPTHTA